MRNVEGIVRMKLDVDGNFVKGLDTELMGDDTDEEEESAVAI